VKKQGLLSYKYHIVDPVGKCRDMRMTYEQKGGRRGFLWNIENSASRQWITGMLQSNNAGCFSR
jgi:hypothetical protein